MASSGGIVDLGDQSHPNYQLSKLNGESSAFLGGGRLGLPKEVRRMIYELAVFVDKPIRPRQVQAGSNKFHWNSKGEGQLATVSLARTCRTMYAEMEHWCPFYRVNTFEFSDTIDGLHPFLAAITPQRREEIRCITLSVDSLPSFFNRHPWTFRNPFHWRRRHDTAYEDVLVLLSQCKDLHSHKLLLTMDLYNRFLVRETIDRQKHSVIKSLKKFLAWAEDPSAKEAKSGHSIWLLPCFRFKALIPAFLDTCPQIAKLM
ncbi:hypothetical protein M426DRAFT_256112 [Hypoxylon sp. CI-4A]|nr:hypothetical protein M426DRAFT_256112 [Hypoxylon sp. CI-4A]